MASNGLKGYKVLFIYREEKRRTADELIVKATNIYGASVEFDKKIKERGLSDEIIYVQYDRIV